MFIKFMSNVKIEKLVFGGQGLGRMGSKIVFLWGAYPEETVEFAVTKKKKNFIEGVATKILVPSPDRVESVEKHYLSCSPWQTLSPEKEIYWKKQIALETYRRVGGVELSDIELVTTGESYHYRNKIEYSFTTISEGRVSLAFFERGKHWNVSISGCELATEPVNRTARAMVEWLSAIKIPPPILKSLVVRSNQKGETAAALFIKQPQVFPAAPTLPPDCVGFQIYRSNQFSPASTPDELLTSLGQNYLTETVLGTNLRYGLLSFFQINVPIFETAVRDIGRFVEGGVAVDYYSGVGAISLPLAKKCSQITLVESNYEAVDFAKQNIVLNALTNVRVELQPAELATEFVTNDATVVVDPPRTGLDKKMVNGLLQKRPHRIVYLSCDLATQARDYGLLKEVYRPIFWRLYNFFPRTPHIEGLVVLEAN